ncbi:MAG: nucleotidyltransferase domain-containing protein [Patescibacteria group bacterium]
MESERLHHEHERAETAPFTPPVVELFLDPSRAGEVWPEHIAENEAFKVQIETRRELNERLETIFSHLPRPDISLQEAIKQGEITESQVADLFASLNPLLEDKDYRRIALYLPFEFFPEKGKPYSETLQPAADQFQKAYMSAWKSLLHTHDVRANFVDGDVLETESRVTDLPRVVKAAHLIPKLVKHGFLKTGDAIKLMETSDDEMLEGSIADTLPVLADMGFIGEAELKRMKASDEASARDMAEHIIEEKNRPEKKEAEGVETPEIKLSSLQGRLRDEFDDIEAEQYDHVTEKRANWLRQEKKRKAIESAGDAIQSAIAGRTVSSETVAQFVSAEANATSQQALVNGLRKTIESAPPEEANNIYKQYQDTLLSLWKNETPELQAELAKTFCRLNKLGVVEDEQLAALGLKIPELAGPFSKNLETMKEEMHEVRDIAVAIESDPELSKKIYPVVSVFGSRLKGYGDKNADIDVGVFVRPETSISERETLTASIKQLFTHEKIQGKVVEFWLEETKDGLAVRDFGKPDVTLGESYWTHVLFGAASEGNKSAIRELREKLLVPYMNDQKKAIHGREARGLYLEEMERDTLQYRLMHKGYEQFNPSFGGIKTPHADLIDGQSAFWDSGYRQTATKLFASRVFIPKISHTK